MCLYLSFVYISPIFLGMYQCVCVCVCVFVCVYVCVCVYLCIRACIFFILCSYYLHYDQWALYLKFYLAIRHS